MRKFMIFLHSVIVVLLNILSKLPLAIIVIFKLRVRYINLRQMYTMGGPYLVLPNHTNQWDPFILSFAIPRPVHWVASDGAFRDSALKYFMILGGAIPKIKEQSDMMTLQEVKKAIAMKHAAGIFPEGEQNWDGRILPLIPATAKLVRFLKVPVVVPLIKGGYLTKPRWAWGVRRSRIEVNFSRIIDAEEIKTMKLPEIERRLNEALHHDEYEWQKEARIPISGEKRAEHMETAYFVCPSCEKIGSLHSEGNELKCTCGYHIHVDRYGFFQYPESGPHFDTPGVWNDWQKNFLESTFRELLEEAGPDSDPVFLSDDKVTLMKAERAKPMRSVRCGQVRLYRDRLEIGDSGETPTVLPLREITGVNTFKQQKFEFRFEKIQYRFSMPTRRISGYKWEIAYRRLRDILMERGEW